MKNIAEIKISFLAGTTFVGSVNEAIRLARLLGVAYVKYDFNDVSVAVSQDADVLDMKKQFNECLRKKDKSQFVCG